MNRRIRITYRVLMLVLGLVGLLGATLGSRAPRAAGAQAPLAPRGDIVPSSAPSSQVEASHLALGGSLPFPKSDDSEEILIPVVGIEKSSLVDTYTQARTGHIHNGIDILAPRGTPVVASVDGTILKLFTSVAGGLTVYLADRNKSLLYYYAHLDHYADGLQAGMTVTQGTVLGYVGTTGNAPPGTPHLHFEIERLPPTGEWWKGEPTNPYPILMAHGTTVRP